MNHVLRQRDQWPHRLARLVETPPGLPDNMYWRGMSDGEWNSIQQNGFVNSDNSRIIPGQEGLTFFSKDPQGAANFVQNSQSLGYAQGGTLHLVGIPIRTPDYEYPDPSLYRPGDYHEVGFRNPIPMGDITHHYELRDQKWTHLKPDIHNNE